MRTPRFFSREYRGVFGVWREVSKFFIKLLKKILVICIIYLYHEKSR